MEAAKDCVTSSDATTCTGYQKLVDCYADCCDETDEASGGSVKDATAGLTILGSALDDCTITDPCA